MLDAGSAVHRPRGRPEIPLPALDELSVFIVVLALLRDA